MNKPLKTKQTNLWHGPFGDSYVERNIVTIEDVNNRQAFWDRTIKQMYMNSTGVPESFIEFGAGQGANLRAIQNIYNQVDKSVGLYATEVNDKAKAVLSDINGLTMVDPNTSDTNIADCGITMGFLIHVHPIHLRQTMDMVYRASKRWIVCAEYFAPSSRPIPYRGEMEALWADDYGSKWIKAYPLRVIGYGFLWKPMTGLDNMVFWFLEKTQ